MIKITTEHKDFISQLRKIIPIEQQGDKQVFTITFQVTEDCCMKCSYCYLISKTPKKMSFKTAKTFIDMLLQDKLTYVNSEKAFGFIFEFIGGEPLMEIKLIDEICSYITEQMIILNHPLKHYYRFSICSNGILYFQPEVQDFLKKFSHFLSFSISIDGNKELHDSCRVDLNGQGTYNRAVNAMVDYRNQYHIQMPTKLTISPTNLPFLDDAIINLIELGYSNISANCIFEYNWQIKDATLFYYKLKNIANYLLESQADRTIFLSLFNDTLFKNIPIEENNENWCGGANDRMLIVDPDGNYYPCIRYTHSSLGESRKPLIIGNTEHGFFFTQEEQINHTLLSNITKSSQSTRECLECPIESGCAWCSGYNYQLFGTPNKRATFICNMHKARYLANLYFWNLYYQRNKQQIKLDNKLPDSDSLLIIQQQELNQINNIISIGG